MGYGGKHDMKTLENIFYVLIMLFVMNWLFSNLIYSFTHPAKTQMEVLKRSPKNFIWNFKN